MCVPNRLRDPKTRAMMVLGNLSLVVALLLWSFVRPNVPASHALTAHAWLDPLAGLFFGISIGSNLMAIRHGRRFRPAEAQRQ